MNKILILEDDNTRMDLFTNELMNGENIIYHVKSVDSAYEALIKEGDINIIMFDNDLGPGGEGRMLAQLIQRDFHMEDADGSYIENIDTVIVHSMNVVAAKNIHDVMEEMVPKTYTIPFGEMLSEPANLAAAVRPVARRF